MTDQRWWQQTTIYQVYPRSFQDSDGDGIGDLRGVIDRLDYLVDLGVGALWLSPIFSSPQRDFGYDITDYVRLATEYGDDATVRELIDEAHARGLKVIFDLVLNHTSDEHPWFVESRASRDNLKADWYLWRDGRRGPLTWLTGRRRPPNNWRATLDLTTAWQWCEERGQYYLASFLPFQPDLNWRNPDVKAAMFDAARYWLAAGVDGFRLDVFGWIMKDPSFRSNPFRPSFGGGDIVRLWRRDFTENTPDNVALAKELRAVCREFEGAGNGAEGAAGEGGAVGAERVLVGEVFGSPDEVRAYLGDDDGLTLTFAFDFLEYKYSARYFRELIASYEEHFAAPMLAAYVLENHDRSRTVDRVGGDERKARLLATMLLTLRGVPTIYQGQEIGMRNTYLPLKGALDPLGRTFLPWMPEWISKRLGERINRDEVRTPMQWDGSVNAGFSAPDATPWLPLNGDAGERNVAAQAQDADSMLALYRTLLHLRRARPALRAGSLTLLDAPGELIAYERRDDQREGASGDAVLVVLNLGNADATFGAASVGGGELLVGTAAGVTLADGVVTLPAHAAAVVQLA
ncbi:alpha-glucosidase [Demequina lutea]|uniref:Glycosidase n=1 Tax=Demequina lutea TaxID=431489 RepID=A0A7Y9Z901_9MICO|nr:alpha-glucosidase [Demequina lutea]NYI40999.1 glycosidase [Demequina lutea]